MKQLPTMSNHTDEALVSCCVLHRVDCICFLALLKALHYHRCHKPLPAVECCINMVSSGRAEDSLLCNVWLLQVIWCLGL
jgi:hypothetical protein